MHRLQFSQGLVGSGSCKSTTFLRIERDRTSCSRGRHAMLQKEGLHTSRGRHAMLQKEGLHTLRTPKTSPMVASASCMGDGGRDRSGLRRGASWRQHKTVGYCAAQEEACASH
jgi:hypothetical protein